MFTTYRLLHRNIIEESSDYSDLVNCAAYHIAHSDDSIRAWLIEWDIFVYAAHLKDTPLSIGPALEAWIDAVRARMRDDAEC